MQLLSVEFSSPVLILSPSHSNSLLAVPTGHGWCLCGRLIQNISRGAEPVDHILLKIRLLNVLCNNEKEVIGDAEVKCLTLLAPSA
jgi:hypothetical protein